MKERSRHRGILLLTCAWFALTLGVGCESPVITNIEPSAAHVGDQVSITAIGFYLGFTQGETTITFNDVDAGLADWWLCGLGAFCEIRIKVPDGAESGCVILTDPIQLGASNCYDFTVLPLEQ